MSRKARRIGGGESGKYIGRGFGSFAAQSGWEDDNCYRRSVIAERGTIVLLTGRSSDGINSRIHAGPCETVL